VTGLLDCRGYDVEGHDCCKYGKGRWRRGGIRGSPNPMGPAGRPGPPEHFGDTEEYVAVSLAPQNPRGLGSATEGVKTSAGAPQVASAPRGSDED
jgi:hypothetical protein